MRPGNPTPTVRPKSKADGRTIPPERRHWDNRALCLGRGPGSTASGHPTSKPPEKRPPPGNIVLL